MPLNNPQKIILFLTRVFFGLFFFQSGLNKLLGDFSAEQFLLNASGPFAQFFAPMAGINLVDFLVIFGEIGVGLALVFGFLMWLAVAGGVLMMALFYLANFPPVGGYININVVYILLFLLLGVFRAEKYWGLEEHWQKYLPKRLQTEETTN